MVSVSLSPLAFISSGSVSLQNDLVGLALCCGGGSHVYVVKTFGVAMNRFLGIEMMGIFLLQPS
jgi:hypothetical protein